MVTILTKDQANLITKKFLTLTSRDIRVEGSEVILHITCVFSGTKISFKGSWNECECYIQNSQYSPITSYFYHELSPFAAINWVLSSNFRSWCKIKKHALKVLDSNRKTISQIDEILDSTFPEEVEQQLLGDK